MRVAHVNGEENRITVQRENGERLTYDPRRLHGVTVYKEEQCVISKGERVQFTAPNNELNVKNRELGTVERVNASGDISLRMDSGREVEFNIRQHPHVDQGYAMTSYSSQAQTIDRVLVHVDTEKSKELVNTRMAYVSVSRARHDAHIYTNDKDKLAERLGREMSHSTAVQAKAPEHQAEQGKTNGQEQKPGRDQEQAQQSERGHGQGSSQAQDQGHAMEA